MIMTLRCISYSYIHIDLLFYFQIFGCLAYVKENNVLADKLCLYYISVNNDFNL